MDGRVLVVKNNDNADLIESNLLSFFFKGILRGTDQTANVILEKCEERVFSSEGTEIVPLGLYIIRGDNV